MTIDLIILGVLIISAIVAFLRGFIREILTIFGVLGGLTAAWLFYDPLSTVFENLMGVDPTAEEQPRFLNLVPYPLLSDILAAISIFVVVVIILTIVSHYLSRGAQSLGLGMLDRTLGVIFGLARGLLLLALLYLPVKMNVDDEQKKEWFKDSRTIIYVEGVANWIAGQLPESFTSKETMDEAKKTSDILEDLDLLPKQDKEDNKDEDADSVAPADQSTKGYQAPQRQSLEEMIENQNRKDNELPENESHE